MVEKDFAGRTPHGRAETEHETVSGDGAVDHGATKPALHAETELQTRRAPQGEGREGVGAPPKDLIEALHRELRAIAEHHFTHERSGHTLQPTAIVNELWLRIADRDNLRFPTKEAFLAYASEAVRHILVDHARRRLATRRGGSWQRIDVGPDVEGGVVGSDGSEPSADAWAISAVELDDELSLLRAQCARSARVFELHHFGGMTERQIGDLLGVSDRTVRKIWRSVRAWMATRIDARRTI